MTHVVVTRDISSSSWIAEISLPTTITAIGFDPQALAAITNNDHFDRPVHGETDLIATRTVGGPDIARPIAESMLSQNWLAQRYTVGGIASLLSGTSSEQRR